MFMIHYQYRSLLCFITSIWSVPVTTNAMSDRVVATVSYYSSAAKKFIDREEITVGDLEPVKLQGTTSDFECLKGTIDLQRGGELTFFANLVPSPLCSEIRAEVDCSDVLKQYRLRQHKEPRVHCLTNSLATGDEDASQPGYIYHGVVLKSQPLSNLTKVESLANRLAKAFKVTDWKVGVNVLKYRDYKDKMGWHADDTHHESLVLSVTIASPTSLRCIQVRPKKENGFLDGDEFITLYPGVGDGYAMDGVMQEQYEHRVPAASKQVQTQTSDEGEDVANTEDNNGRYVLIFRDGDLQMVKNDSGVATDGKAPDRSKELNFGRCEDVLIEGCLFKRIDMMDSGAHRSDFRGVSGNAEMGCNAIIIAKQDDFVQSQDHLFSFMYLATTAQGANALCTSYVKRLPIRVFRSSKLEINPFAPPKRETVDYRYDGIYYIERALDDKNDELIKNREAVPTKYLPSGPITYRFILTRAPAGQGGNALTDQSHLAHCLRMKTMKKAAPGSHLLRFTGRTARTCKIQKIM